MVDRPEFERWRMAAADALRAAEVQADADLHNWSCFLAEQAAQLGVKGLLHGMGAGAWGHDLEELGRRWAEAGGAELPEDIAAALRRLARHYIPTRYPDATPAGPPLKYYGRDDAQAALEDARAVLATADRAWAALESA
ncbi:MAG: HEPN domain-containing protein [Longimicrobiales bacterium]